MKVNIPTALNILSQGGIIAYPTETVYGIGCDATNENALQRLIALKHRSPNKGLIVLINQLEQLAAFTPPLTSEELQFATSKWPGPYTLVFPALPTVSQYLTGQYQSIAIRMTSHPTAAALCESFPITSTSANLSGETVATNYQGLIEQFGDTLDGIVEGEVSPNGTPSQIIDIKTKQRYR